MLILQPHIFRQFPGIIFGFSTKYGDDYVPPFYFNLSLTVDDDREKVINRRKYFFSSIGLSLEKAAFQKQVHGDGITFVTAPGNTGESDAMITSIKGIALSISTADCTAVFIYDTRRKIIAAVHSGWRGTHKKIVEKTIKKLKSDFGSDEKDMFVYLAPSISMANYEVGREVAQLFDSKYMIERGDKFLLDVASANYDMLLEAGIPKYQIQKSNLCSFEYDELFQSYRRDGKQSGRALGIIAMKEAV
ncbi:MAG TPA: peptidoglycan editing factor PgeF [Ignavibacteriaceae bacterium]